jgi:hypothetical protein
MSIRFLARAGLATLLGLVLGLSALWITGGDTKSSPFSGATSNFVPRLSLIRQAQSGELISLQVAPFEVGPNDFRVTLLNPVGKPQKTEAAQLRFSRLESSDVLGEVDGSATGQSQEAPFALSEVGWWQVDVIVNGEASATFYLKLDQQSMAPKAYAPPQGAADPQAQKLFEGTIARYQRLNGLRSSEELTSGDPGPSGYGIWFVTALDESPEGLHATTLATGEGSSELYGGPDRQCVRQKRDPWNCSDGPSPQLPFDLGYLKAATGFQRGREEAVDGEMSQVIFFYNPSQGAWYAWWVGEETRYVRRQAMVANGHFMLDRFSGHDVPTNIQPKDLPVQ